jgi:hypothetical protein
MPPSDFIWLAEQGSMFSKGLSAEIWFRGGREGVPPESILSPEMACQAPVLPLKD